MANKFLENLPDEYSNYLKITLDPYHDASIRFEGAPTSRNATSVVLCINQERTYSAEDFGINPQTKPQWDAHFVMYPFLTAKTLVGGVEYNNTTGLLTLQRDAADVYPTLYPLSVQGVPTGEPTYCVKNFTDLDQDYVWDIQGLSNQSLVSYVTGSSTTNPNKTGPGRRTLRIVGESFEVVDESPDIYSQGACTVYRYPLDVTPASRIVRFPVPALTGTYPATAGPNPIANTYDGSTYAGGVISQCVNTYDLRSPPVNTSVAVLVPGSKTWKAQEGCYVVGTQYEGEIPFKTLDTMPTIFTGYQPTVGTSFNDSTAVYSFADAWITQEFQGSVNNAVTNDRQYYVSEYGDPIADACFPFNLSGAYFTGLSTQYASLRLRYRVYVEILTDPCDNLLAPLGSPTVPYDQALQELCMKVIASQEAGVPQTMNPAGEKWKRVLSSISKSLLAVSPVLSAMGPLGPEMSLIAQGMGNAARAGSSIAGRSAKKQKPKPKA
nr:hypothetical protein [Sobelivirales sp.]